MRFLPFLIVLAVVVAFAMPTCESDLIEELAAPESAKSDARPDAGLPASAVAVTPSAGCGLEPPVAVGQPGSVSFSSATARDGSYALYLPEAYDRDHPTALVVGLHGWTGNGSSSLRESGSDISADAEGIIAVWPDGVAYPEAGQGWAFPGCNASPPAGTTDAYGRRAVCDSGNAYTCDATTCPSEVALALCEETGLQFLGESSSSASCLNDDGAGHTVDQTACDIASGGDCNWCGCVDDEAFVRAVVDHVAETACVDLNRVYLTGMSQGGMMTSWLYSRAGDVFAAFAPLSGTNPRDFFAHPPDTDTEASVLFIHGANDSVVPHDGQPASDGYTYMAVWDEVERMSEYAFGEGMCGEWQDWPVPSGVNAPREAELECRQRACTPPAGDERAFVYCTFDGGHVWPRAQGRKESALWGNRLVWAFFVEHCNEPGNGCSTSYTPPGGDRDGGK